MRLVLRIAGSLLENESSLRPLARQITALTRDGHELLVIHGGERFLTATLKRVGTNSRFESGLRITDRRTRDIAMVVLAGVLRARVVSEISAAHQPAIGISAGCFQADPLVRNEVTGLLGYVGYLRAIDESLLASHWQKGTVPVAAPFGTGADGEIYCIHADHMAAACAEYLCADQLVYLTKAPGILTGGTVLPFVNCEEIGSLVHGGLLSVDMVLKLESAKRALEGGVRGVRIINGTYPDALLGAVAAEQIGTVVSQHSVSNWGFSAVTAAGC